MAAAVLAALLACTEDPDDDEAEVAGLVLDREDGVDADGDAGSAPDTDRERSDGEGPIGDLLLVRSGPMATGTTWLAVEGEWIGLDGQRLERDDVRVPLHLDALLDTDGGAAELRGCELRIVAPDDADLEASGRFSSEAVIERASGEEVRVPLGVLELDLALAPGEMGAHAVPADDELVLDAERDLRVWCEGRFDRS